MAKRLSMASFIPLERGTIDNLMNNETETVDGYACPIDPSEFDSCESCQ